MADIITTTPGPTSKPRLALAGTTAPLWLAYATLVVAGGTGLIVVYLFDPRNPGPYPVCPFLGLTGCYCPGCGTLRALHLLLNGNPVAAFGYNPYSMLALPAIGYSLVASGLRAYHLPAPPRINLSHHWIWALLAAILAFWLLRNLPFAPFTILAP